MTREFDSGLALPQRTIVRQGAVTVLSALKRANGGYLHDVKGFGGVVRTYTDDLGLEHLTKVLGPGPSIGVTLASRKFQNLAIHTGRLLGEPRAKTQPQALSELTLQLYFASQHGRDSLTGRHEPDPVAMVDDGADPGLDAMMEHALELMHGSYLTQVIGTVKQLQIDMEEELASLPQITIWVQTYRLTLHSYTGSREFRTADQIKDSLHVRITNDLGEDNRPDPPISPTSLDVNYDPDP